MGNWEDLISELNIVETKYWKHFRKTRLCDHYILQEDEEKTLRFGFKKDSDLPVEIKKECLQIFKKYKSNQRFA